MKIQQIRDRLQKERPTTTINIHIPEDVVEDLKRVAPLRGFTGYESLVRAYIGQGLRQDLERFFSTSSPPPAAHVPAPSET